MNKISFSFVMTTCESFSSHRNMLQLKKLINFKIPWIAYFMDPYAYFIKNRGCAGKLLETERQVYEQSDLIFVTEEIYEENQNNAFTPFLYKTKPFKFGNFRFIDNKLKNQIFDKDKINCVFVGSLLNKSIRDPEYLYKVINNVSDKYLFHMICNNLSSDNKKQADNEINAKDRVRWYNNLTLNECLGIINNADVLINLGNKSLNQTPSKIFDYIGTGRPIVNFHSLKNDTSKRYLEQYPNKLNIFEDSDLIMEETKKFIDFAESNKGYVVSKTDLENLYQSYQSSKVTKDTVKEIEILLAARGID